MSKKLRKVWLAALLLSLGALSAEAKKPRFAPLTPLTPEQAALIDKAAAREKLMVKELQKRVPIVQTYIQNIKADPKLSSVPASDTYLLSRVDFGKTFQAEGYQEKDREKRLFQRVDRRAERHYESAAPRYPICSDRLYGHDVYRCQQLRPGAL
ncbi:hypothetical protein [Acidisarcina polymorpha]|uniref:hypothetical protein n=1 Tax=Acidisarcina polymorpha TaxID=2211140 RepID=UPI000DEF275D|nr:hypothetical protein [Acidisarcina polymorpha]